MTPFSLLTTLDFNDVIIEGGKIFPHFQAGSVLQKPYISENCNLNKKNSIKEAWATYFYREGEILPDL